MMDETKNKQRHRIWFLILAFLVSAWLLPTTAALASTSASTPANSSKMRVTLTVEDAVGVDFGSTAVDSTGADHVIALIYRYVSHSDELRHAAEAGTLEAGRVTNPAEVIVTVSEL